MDLRRCKSTCLLALFAVMSEGPSFAQNARITGRVLDGTGSVVPGAQISTLSVESGWKRSTTSNEFGNFTIAILPPGTYQLLVQKHGFRTLARSDIRLELNQVLRVDMYLDVGSTSEAIQVSAGQPVLRAEDAGLDEPAWRKQLIELPLNGRQFFQLATITMPGVRTGYSTFANGVRLSAGGQRENQNQFLLSGIIIQNNLINSVSMRPSVEAIDELRVMTGNFSAEHGMYSGAQVAMNLRAGTNELHGTMFEFFRNDRLDARNFFEGPETAKAPFRRNQFGFVVSGPILLKGIYSGLNRTFFMLNGEYVRHRRSQVDFAVVPSTAFRQGDFSALGTPVRDPFTLLPFPGNRMPESRLNRSSLALQDVYPLPNQAGPSNYRAHTRGDIDNHQTVSRVDHVIGSNGRLYGSYIYQLNNSASQGVLPVDLRKEVNGDWSLALNESQIFRPSVMNEFRLGMTRLQFTIVNAFTGSDFSIRDAFGMVGFPEGDPRLAGLPGINITGMSGLSSTGPLLQVDETVQLADNLSIVTGRHLVKAGYDVRKGRVARRSANWPRGLIHFTGEMTGAPYADFLLGLPRRSDGVEQQNWAEARTWRNGLFVADDWKVNGRLTLNLGIRYELFTVPLDPYGRLRSLNPQDWTRLTPEPYVPAKLFQGDHNNWAPRVGFAIRTFPKTVFRGGYGIYYNANQLNNITLLQSNPPFRLAPTVLSDPANPVVSISDPYQTGGSLPAGPFNIATVDASGRLPNAYTQNYSFLVQQELLPRTSLEIGYVGAQTKHLDRADSANHAPPGPGAIQPRRPFPMWADIRVLRNDVTSSYNSLQSTLRRRTSNGLTLAGTYAWSKAIDDGNDFNSGARTQDPERRYLERGPSQFDVTHRLTWSVVYELPFFAGEARNLPRIVLGGWQLNGIYVFESGRPFSVNAAGDRANTGSGVQRADRLADGRLPGSERGINHWFATGAFAQPREFTYGNGGRHILRGPAVSALDIGAVKNFFVREGHSLQFRGEFFGVTNTPNFGLPGAIVGTPLFGMIRTAQGNRNIQMALKYAF
ncbi:MAG: TonB-dependent receptor [Bryobacterales bacterium]|nr:TonB-dependent receptor [Bryobacterales bacterium]